MGPANPQMPGLQPEPLERRVGELAILYEVSRALPRLSDEEKILRTILIGLTHGRGLGFDRAFALLVDSDRKWLEGRMAAGPFSSEEASVFWRNQRKKHETIRVRLSAETGAGVPNEFYSSRGFSQFRIPLSNKDNLLLKVMRSREPGMAANGTFEPHGFPVYPELPEQLGMCSFAAAPLFADEDLGLLIADNFVTKAPIEFSNLELLQVYAQEASSAVQNVRLCRELKKKIDLCERTNQKMSENQAHLLQAERLSTIGKMAALLAHEIRTPLVSIGGFARRILRTTPADDPRKEEIDIIVSEVSRLEKLIHEVLEYGRLSTPEYKPIDVNHLVRAVLLMVSDEIEKHSVRTVVHLDSSLPFADVDESQLRQALLNLVTNAMEAMPFGGTLTVATSLDQEYFEIAVSDTGIGITSEDFGKLFTPFFTTKADGIGLGLAIVSNIADNHNGSLRFESVPDQGTTFHIRLALHPRAPIER